MTTEQILKKVERLRRSANRKREVNSKEGVEESKSLLNKAVETLESGITAEQTDDEKRVLAQRLYQCYGSLGGTWRDSALVAPKSERNQILDHSIRFYDKGFLIESGKQFPGLKFADSFNLVQRLVVRVLKIPQSLQTDYEGTVEGLNVIQEIKAAEEKVIEQLSNERRDDPWAMADLAQLRILQGEQDYKTAWREFAEEIRDDYVYESNYRAWKTLHDLFLFSGQSLERLPAVNDTIDWLKDRLKSIYEIEV